MLWRIGVLVAAGCLAVQMACGAEEAVLNNPPQTVSTIKSLINQLDPSYETFWNWGEGNFSQGASISLYNITSEEIPLASVRVGTGTGMTLYGGVSLDLPGLTRRYVPETIKGFATVQPLQLLWGVVGKYARVGVVGGYSWDDHTPAYGMTAGAALNF